jgi:uncharacterized membrane protein
MDSPTSVELFDFILKVFTLFFLSAESHIAFKKRYWARAIITFAIWLTVFRLAILRAIAISIGLFGHLDNLAVVNAIQNYLMGAGGSIFTDIVLLLGVIFSFIITVGDCPDNQGKKSKKNESSLAKC